MGTEVSVIEKRYEIDGNRIVLKEPLFYEPDKIISPRDLYSLEDWYNWLYQSKPVILAEVLRLRVDEFYVGPREWFEPRIQSVQWQLPYELKFVTIYEAGPLEHETKWIVSETTEVRWDPTTNTTGFLDGRPAPPGRYVALLETTEGVYIIEFQLGTLP
jgi:hypothetical protein